VARSDRWNVRVVRTSSQTKYQSNCRIDSHICRYIKEAVIIKIIIGSEDKALLNLGCIYLLQQYLDGYTVPDHASAVESSGSTVSGCVHCWFYEHSVGAIANLLPHVHFCIDGAVSERCCQRSTRKCMRPLMAM
jgi:hypothetical protein